MKNNKLQTYSKSSCSKFRSYFKRSRSKRIILQTSTLAIILILFSCQKVIEIDYPPQETKLVVNCLFTPDSLFKARISKTSFTTDSSDLSIKNATCEIWSNGQFLETLQHTQNGFYVSENLYPEIEKNYTIKVKHQELGEVTGSSYVPDFPAFYELNFAYNDTYQDEEDQANFEEASYVEFIFCFQDNPKEKNYYEIMMHERQNFEDEYPGDWQPLWIKSDDPVILNEDLLEYSPMPIPFSDSLINGQQYNLRVVQNLNLDINDWYDDDTITLSLQHEEIYYHFRCISKQFYNYRKSLTQQNGLYDYFFSITDPVQMTTNINNGYGVFAGYTEYSKLLHDTIIILQE